MSDHDSNENNTNNRSALHGVVNEISQIGGGEGLGDFSLKSFFQQTFKSHSEEEVERSLIYGTAITTPSIDEVDISYPQPWLFFRLLAGALILFYGFVFSYNSFDNANLIPGLIFSGSFGVPVATVFLFYELNIRRNVSLWQVMRLVLFGGILSLFIALFLFDNFDFFSSSMGASAAGVIEEPAKLAALVILMRGKKRYPYILNGLLLGASVGCGFAAFESAGYALNLGLLGSLLSDEGGIASLIDIIQLRGVLSPLAHIVWTAVAGGALWRVMQGGDFRFSLLKKKEFSYTFIAVMACHAVWNSDLELPFLMKYWILGVVAWILALSQVNLGIKQVKSEKNGQKAFVLSQDCVD